MHRPICEFFYHRNTGVGRFQYLGIDKSIGGRGEAISKLLLTRCCPAPCSEAAPTPKRMRERVCVCLCSKLSHLTSHPHKHTHTCAMRASTYGGTSKGKYNRQCTCTILYRCGHRENVEIIGALYSYHQNQQDSKKKPTLFGAAQNLSASRNILFIYFQICVKGMASSQKGKSVHFRVAVKQRTCLLWIHLISSQSLNLGGRRGTTYDGATIPFHHSLSSAVLRESHSRPFLDVIFPFLLLSSSPACSFHCPPPHPLQNCLRHARGS